jgi:hypothetical protein
MTMAYNRHFLPIRSFVNHDGITHLNLDSRTRDGFERVAIVARVVVARVRMVLSHIEHPPMEFESIGDKLGFSCHLCSLLL